MFRLIKKIVTRAKTVTPLSAFILLAALATLVLGVKYFATSQEWFTVRIEVRGRDWSEDFSEGKGFNPPAWLIGTIKVGDTELGLDGRPVARVVAVEEYGDVKPTIIVTAKTRVVTSKRAGKYSFKNRALEVGAPIELALPKTKVLGQITALGVPPDGFPQKNIIAALRMRNIEPWLVNKIAVGDKMSNQADGTIVAEILTKSIESPVSSVFIANPQYFTNQFLETNPRLKDVVLSARLKVVKLPEGWRFAGNQILKVGSLDKNDLKLSFADYNLPFVEVQDFHDETAP